MQQEWTETHSLGQLHTHPTLPRYAPVKDTDRRTLTGLLDGWPWVHLITWKHTTGCHKLVIPVYRSVMMQLTRTFSFPMQIPAFETKSVWTFTHKAVWTALPSPHTYIHADSVTEKLLFFTPPLCCCQQKPNTVQQHHYMETWQEVLATSALLRC